jgi:ribonuclease J
MTAIEYGNDIIVIDAGDTFPDEEMPGVDLVVPDVSYLIERKDKIRGVLLTHGHEDHIGGLAYLLKEINPSTPVYATQLTLALADNKVRELHLQNTDFRTVKSGSKVKLGVFTVEFVNVNHSIAGAAALAITTPYGIIYHSGDFKIDMTPVAGEPIDLHRIAELGEQGVLLYMGESTNIERPGYTMSERVVGATFDRLFAEHASRRLIIATFASNVHRLQQIIDLSVKYKRKVALSGRSMLNVVEAAKKIGELNIPEGVLVDVEKSKNYFDREIVIVSTGSQGEPMSALTRMASGEFNKVNIGENDTIIISASPIPGNEKMIYRVINNLYKKGAEVVYESLEKIHVSGHACREEHKIIHTLLKPKFFVPVHGEYRHLRLHADLAAELGMPRRNIFLPDIGTCLELTDSSIRHGENFQAGATIIDGTGEDDYNTSSVLRDRKQIAAEGVIIVSLAVHAGEVVGEPKIENIGILLGDERDYETEIKGVVRNAIVQYNLAQGNNEGLAKSIEKTLKGYLYRKTKQSPLILPTIIELE